MYLGVKCIIKILCENELKKKKNMKGELEGEDKSES